MKLRSISATVCAIAAAAVVGSAAEAQSPEQFFKEKPVKVMVGHSPGGSYDFYARLAADMLRKHLPGGHPVIVENKPGGGGLVAVTQFYSGAGLASAGGRIVGGTQDNGSVMLTVGNWSIYRGGDGGFAAVDPASDQWIYGSYVYLALHRSANGGANSIYICQGITEGLKSTGNSTYCGANATQEANFIAPFILDPNNASRMLAGANSLWVTDNVKATPPAWRTIKAPSAASGNYINAIAVHEGNGNLVWVGHNNGELYATTNGLATAPAWQRMGQGVSGHIISTDLIHWSWYMAYGMLTPASWVSSWRCSSSCWPPAIRRRRASAVRRSSARPHPRSRAPRSTASRSISRRFAAAG